MPNFIPMLLLCFFSLILSPVTAMAFEDDDLEEFRQKMGNDWVLVKNDKRRDIKTWIKQEDNKRFRSFKIEATINSSMANLVHLFLDTDNYPRWYWEVLEAKILKKLSATDYHIYVKHRAPHGIPDRDVAGLLRFTPQTITNHTLTLEVRSIPDLVAVKPPLVRMVAEDALVKATPIGINKIHYVVEGYVDPGGQVPVWASNSLQRTIPYQVILGEKRMLESMPTDGSMYKNPLPFNVYEYSK